MTSSGDDIVGRLHQRGADERAESAARQEESKKRIEQWIEECIKRMPKLRETAVQALSRDGEHLLTLIRYQTVTTKRGLFKTKEEYTGHEAAGWYLDMRSKVETIRGDSITSDAGYLFLLHDGCFAEIVGRNGYLSGPTPHSKMIGSTAGGFSDTLIRLSDEEALKYGLENIESGLRYLFSKNIGEPPSLGMPPRPKIWP